jgi:hypothetical protein
MNTTITINFTPEGKLELPPEISQIFSEGEQYSVRINSDTISFKKVPKFDGINGKKILTKQVMILSNSLQKKFVKLSRKFVKR